MAASWLAPAAFGVSLVSLSTSLWQYVMNCRASVRPVLVLLDHKPYCFVNVGNGPAINVRCISRKSGGTLSNGLLLPPLTVGAKYTLPLDDGLHEIVVNYTDFKDTRYHTHCIDNESKCKDGHFQHDAFRSARPWYKFARSPEEQSCATGEIKDYGSFPGTS